MSRLPLDPPLAALLLASARFECTCEALAVVSMLSTDRVFVTSSTSCAPLLQYDCLFVLVQGTVLL